MEDTQISTEEKIFWFLTNNGEVPEFLLVCYIMGLGGDVSKKEAMSNAYETIEELCRTERIDVRTDWSGNRIYEMSLLGYLTVSGIQETEMHDVMEVLAITMWYASGLSEDALLEIMRNNIDFNKDKAMDAIKKASERGLVLASESKGVTYYVASDYETAVNKITEFIKNSRETTKQEK